MADITITPRSKTSITVTNRTKTSQQSGEWVDHEEGWGNTDASSWEQSGTPLRLRSKANITVTNRSK